MWLEIWLPWLARGASKEIIVQPKAGGFTRIASNRRNTAAFAGNIRFIKRPVEGQGTGL
jgi:hypothetical protein